jgi:hypothetical protein
MDNSLIDEESSVGSEVSLFEKTRAFTPLGKKK